MDKKKGTNFDDLPAASTRKSGLTVLLAGNHSADLEAMYDALASAQFNVQWVENFAAAEELWLRNRHQAVLLDVSHQDAVPAALSTATRIKRRDPRQFLAYITDPILRSSGLAGDAIFSRDARTLPEALLRCFAMEQMTDGLSANGIGVCTVPE